MTALSASLAESTTERLTRLLLSAVPEDLARFEQLSAGVTDWDAVIAHARSQGVAGVLWHYLALSDAGAAPELKKDAVRYLSIERLAQTKLRGALDESLRALDAAGIRTVALKGPTLGDRIYPAPSLRPSTDIDLMVAPADLDRAIAVLESIGFESQSGALERYYRENHHHLHLSRPRTPPLELHFRATTGFGTIMPAEDLLARSTGGVLSPEDEFLYLAVHAARHLFEALVWLYDLKLFLLRHPDLDWTLVAERANSLGVASALWLALQFLDLRLATGVARGADIRPPHPLWARLTGPVRGLATGLPKESMREVACRNLYRALLCDRPLSSLWFFRLRVIRFARRRARRYFPMLAPQGWSE